MEYKSIEQMVVPFADTCTQPDAVVVKLEYTIVADMAVVAPWWFKDVASRTELEFKHLRRVGL
jgi:hypothetical protein